MKIRKKVTRIEMVDLDIEIKGKCCILPTTARKKHDLLTPCNVCGKEIEEDAFIAIIGTSDGDLMLHRGCAPAEVLDEALLLNGGRC